MTDTISKKMRVLSVLIKRPDGPRVGGAADAARSLSVELSKQIDLDFAEISDRERTEPWQKGTYHFTLGYHGIPKFIRRIFRFLNHRYFNVFSFSNTAKILDGTKYDVVHIYNLHPIWAAAQIAFVCKRRKIPTVLACHGIHETANRAELLGINGLAAFVVFFGNTLPLKYLVKNCRLVYASSEADISVLEKLGVKRSQIKVVTNGVAPAYFKHVSDDRLLEVKSKYDFPEHTPLLLFVGHLNPKKGVDTLIEALAKIRPDKPWHLAVVGPHTFPELVQDLKEMMQRLGIADRVTFTGQVPFSDISILHQLADVFVLPSRSETLPLAILEAMSKSKPVIGTTVGGIPHQLRDDAGILVQPDDVDGLARAIQKLLDEPGTRQAMGDKGYQRVIAEFTWAVAAQQALEGYNELA